MAKQDVEMKEAPKQNDTAEAEEPQAEVSKEEKESERNIWLRIIRVCHWKSYKESTGIYVHRKFV